MKEKTKEKMQIEMTEKHMMKEKKGKSCRRIKKDKMPLEMMEGDEEGYDEG